MAAGIGQQTGRIPGAVAPFDRLLFRRALAFSVAATLLALGVVVLTDEPLSTPGMRAARMAAFAPALAALGVSVALAQARGRGELRALAALGASPWRAARGAVLAGWLVGALAVALLASPWSDVSVLFPAMPSHAQWHRHAAALVDPASGVRVAADGVIGFVAAHRSRAVDSPGALAALAAVTPLAALAPPWAGTRLSLLSRALGAGLAIVLAIVLLHVVASGRAPALVLVLAALPLAVQSVAGRAAGPDPTGVAGGQAA